MTFHGRIEINPDEVQLWYAYDEEIAEGNLLGQHYGLLSAEEREQQQRFHLAKHRHQYMITRALARTVLSAYTDGIVPSAWKFQKNAFNKPYIASSPLPLPLRFNLSHTEKMVVMAVTLDREVGVDVEFLLRKVKRSGGHREKLFLVNRIRKPFGVARCTTKAEFLRIMNFKRSLYQGLR